jgi:hypothetical protein
LKLFDCVFGVFSLQRMILPENIKKSLTSQDTMKRENAIYGGMPTNPSQRHDDILLKS